MTAMSEIIRPYAESFEAFQASKTVDIPVWLSSVRRAAFARFAEQGFPSVHAEDWKYTSTRTLEKRAFSQAPMHPATIAASDIQSALLEGTTAHTLIFVNGQHAPALSQPAAVPAGLHVNVIAQALAHAASNLENLLTSKSNWEDDPFTALNTAFLRDGVVIQIDAGVHIETPIQLLFVSTGQEHAFASHPRILVQLGAGAQATLVETWFGLVGANSLTNSYTQVILDEGAQLEHLRLQREHDEEFHVSRVRVSQQQGSRYQSHTLNLGGLWIRNDLESRLEASEAEAAFSGLYLVDGRRHVDNHTRVDHLAPDTRSDELYRGIIDEHGHAVFNGKVVVAKHAIGTDAAQANNNLLLSRHGEIDTKPELEIYADDVKCSHGATIGQLDEQALFYLRSRGLSLEDSRSILVGAFALAVLDRIKSPALRVFARQQMTAMLPQSAVMESA
jgi:Fe-S cluster assembly protein SufD